MCSPLGNALRKLPSLLSNELIRSVKLNYTRAPYGCKCSLVWFAVVHQVVGNLPTALMCPDHIRSPFKFPTFRISLMNFRGGDHLVGLAPAIPLRGEIFLREIYRFRLISVVSSTCWRQSYLCQIRIRFFFLFLFFGVNLFK